MNFRDVLPVGALLAFLYLAYMNYAIRKENQVLKSDMNGLNVSIHSVMDTSRNRLGQMKAQVSTVVLSQDVATDLIREDIQKIRKDFDVKIKDVKAYTQVGTQYTVPIIVKGRDTIIREHTEKIYHLGGRYSGRMITKGDSLMGELHLSYTLRIAVSKGKRKTWWKVWKKRPLVTNAFLANPDGSITNFKSVLTE
jgi:hypothetical protein